MEGKNLLDTLTACGVADKPFWITETGWKSNNSAAQQQADNYSSFFDGLATRDWISRVFFYELNDVAGFPDQWGIVDANFVAKPAYPVIQAHIS